MSCIITTSMIFTLIELSIIAAGITLVHIAGMKIFKIFRMKKILIKQ